MSDNYHDYQLLLAKAAQLYERHGVGRPEPFNVFSVLYKETDEVNLHSRFLHALLDYKKPGTETRENLKDFLLHVDVQGFELYGVEVKREWKNIDILLTNANKKALALENKINAEDRPKQLWRYYNTLKKQNYLDRNIHLLYLTLDGRDPTLDSVGDLNSEKITTVSYKELIPWLGCCQKRAYDEPELRESIAQYIQLVQKLTRTDARGKYMDALKKLCLEDNNFVLIHNLHKAMIEIESAKELLWEEIEAELRSEEPDFIDASVSKDGLSYELNEVSQIHVGAHPVYGRIWFGVYCSKKEHEHKYDKIKKSLESFLSGGEPDTEEMYPWWRYADTNLNLKNLTREDLEILSNEEKRKKVVRKVVQGLQELLEVIEDIAMVNAIEEGAKTELVPEEQIFEILRRGS